LKILISIFGILNYKENKNMTVIRLTRMGRNKKPFYRIVVTDSRKRRDSGWIESIGYFNPVTEPKVLKIDEERLNYWLSVGAQMSEKVKKLSGK
jgi:small subunit ribosomal protein S16